jgi:hypothetical protein
MIFAATVGGAVHGTRWSLLLSSPADAAAASALKRFLVTPLFHVPPHLPRWWILLWPLTEGSVQSSGVGVIHAKHFVSVSAGLAGIRKGLQALMATLNCLHPLSMEPDVVGSPAD